MKVVTSLCFGGVDLTDLFVTTGRMPLFPHEEEGSLYKISGLGSKGKPIYLYKD